MRIIKASQEEVPEVVRLALQLWPGHTQGEFTEEYTRLLVRRDAAVFLAWEADRCIGFAQCQLRRDYVEGTESSPVGYLEGIFVESVFRGQGVAGRLLSACESWAREQGCREFASDCELDNEASLKFHLHLGFAEANRIICFTKKLK